MATAKSQSKPVRLNVSKSKYKQVLNFYTQGLGFSEIPVDEKREEGDLNCAHLGLGQECMLEITDQDSAIGAHDLHVNLTIPNASAVYNRALTMGADSYIQPTQISVGTLLAQQNLTVAFLSGPCGEIIQLIQKNG